MAQDQALPEHAYRPTGDQIVDRMKNILKTGPRFLKDRHILLTGASSGIGRELALQLAPQGARLMLVARSEQPLHELAEQLLNLGADSAIPIVGDITDPAIRSAVFENIKKFWGCLDLLINNAGISAHGRFETNDEQTLRRIMEVNFFAATELTRLAIPYLQTGINPMVVNVSSILGHRGIPHNSEYCASKFALRGWSESIRPELSRKQIDLLLVSPGTTETEFFDHLIAKRDKNPWPPQKGISAGKVAQQIIRAIEKRRHEIYPNWRGRALTLLNRFCPRIVDAIMTRYG